MVLYAECGCIFYLTDDGCNIMSQDDLQNTSFAPSSSCICDSEIPSDCLYINQTENTSSHQMWFSSAYLLHGFEFEDETNVIDPQSFRVDVWDIKESSWRNMDFTISTVRI